MPKGLIIEVNGVRYEAVEDIDTPVFTSCSVCDYKEDRNGDCGAFCCEMDLYDCHFKRIDKEKK